MFQSVLFSPPLRTISPPLRKGASRAQWYELALAEASNKIQLVTCRHMPAPGVFLHEDCQFFTTHEVKTLIASYMPQWYTGS